jgi:hypothetical protein
MVTAMVMKNRPLSVCIVILNRFKLRAQPEDNQVLVCLLRIVSCALERRSQVSYFQKQLLL